MIRVILDTSILLKSIFKPLRSLSPEAYSRELETHEKCKREDAILFTDDSGMHHHAEEVGVNSILVRCTDLKTLERKLE